MHPQASRQRTTIGQHVNRVAELLSARSKKSAPGARRFYGVFGGMARMAGRNYRGLSSL